MFAKISKKTQNIKLRQEKFDSLWFYHPKPLHVKIGTISQRDTLINPPAAAAVRPSYSNFDWLDYGLILLVNLCRTNYGFVFAT